MDEPPKHYDEKTRERLADDLATLIIFGICAVLSIGIVWYVCRVFYP